MTCKSQSFGQESCFLFKTNPKNGPFEATYCPLLTLGGARCQTIDARSTTKRAEANNYFRVWAKQACSPLIQLFFGFASDIDQTNTYRDNRDGNWLSNLCPQKLLTSF